MLYRTYLYLSVFYQPITHSHTRGDASESNILPGDICPVDWSSLGSNLPISRWPAHLRIQWVEWIVSLVLAAVIQSASMKVKKCSPDEKRYVTQVYWRTETLNWTNCLADDLSSAGVLDHRRLCLTDGSLQQRLWLGSAGFWLLTAYRGLCESSQYVWWGVFCCRQTMD